MLENPKKSTPPGKTLIQIEKDLTQAVDENVKQLKALLETFSLASTLSGRSLRSP